MQNRLSSMPIVEIQDLTKAFGDFVAVDGLDLSLERGEVLALLGPNGSGKTTTIRMLMGILQPTRGSASILGHSCFGERHLAMGEVGYVPDEPIFYDYLTGDEIIRFVSDMHGLDRAESLARSAMLLERLELGDALADFATNYSKGMKKKLAFVCALLHRPKVLVLDEPASGLDPFATRVFQELVRELADDGQAVFYSTHLLDQAERVCDRAAILANGKLAAVGTLDQLRSELRSGGSLEDLFFRVAGSGSDSGHANGDPDASSGEARNEAESPARGTADTPGTELPPQGPANE